MPNCKPTCSLCKNLYISSSVTFTGGNLVINIPQTSILDGSKICLVVAQTIPTTTTINAPVFVSIGTGTQLYPITNRCCAQVTACAIRTRTRYSMVLTTSATTGTFKLLGNTCPCPTNNLRSINGTAPVATPATPATASTTGTDTATV